MNYGEFYVVMIVWNVVLLLLCERHQDRVGFVSEACLIAQVNNEHICHCACNEPRCRPPRRHKPIQACHWPDIDLLPHGLPFGVRLSWR